MENYTIEKRTISNTYLAFLRPLDANFNKKDYKILSKTEYIIIDGIITSNKDLFVSKLYRNLKTNNIILIQNNIYVNLIKE